MLLLGLQALQTNTKLHVLQVLAPITQRGLSHMPDGCVQHLLRLFWKHSGHFDHMALQPAMKASIKQSIWIILKHFPTSLKV